MPRSQNEERRQLKLTCHTCGTVYSSRRELFRHRREVHGNEAYQCPLCPYINSSRTGLLSGHARLRHPYARLTSEDLHRLNNYKPHRSSCQQQRASPNRQSARGRTHTSPAVQGSGQHRPRGPASRRESRAPIRPAEPTRGSPRHQLRMPMPPTRDAELAPEGSCPPTPRRPSPGPEEPELGSPTRIDASAQTDSQGPLQTTVTEWQPVSAVLLVRTTTTTTRHPDGRIVTTTPREVKLS